MFEVIKGIDIGQGPGNAFGGGIYSASCQLGFSNGPTKISLSVVKEKGEYADIVINANEIFYNIDLNGVEFPKMYLISYKKTRDSDSRLLTLDFVDSSIFLDKIQIGLLNRHGRAQVQTKLETAEFNVRCMNCGEGSLSEVNGFAKRYLDKIPLNDGSYFEKDGLGGGFIILGQEYFTESNCEIPNVDYNFSDLCKALTAFGLEHNLIQFDLNGFYRQQYVGSLREVLNSWGSDFGFEFFWDGNAIKGVDLKIPLNLSAIEAFSETNEYVLSAESGETLENSYTQKLIARYLQPSRAREYNSTYYYRSEGRQIFLEDIVENGTQAGRRGDVLYTSVALSKYDQALRDVYLGSRIADYFELELLEALGAENIWRLDGSRTSYYHNDLYPDHYAFKQALIKKNLKLQNFYDFDNNLGDEEVLKKFSSSAWGDPDNWEIFLVKMREDRGQKIRAWDSNAANFIGQYYYFSSAPGETSFGCPISKDSFVYYSWNSTWTTVPQSNVYGKDSLPFKELLVNPISDTPMNSAGILEELPIFNMSDNTWGLQSEDYEKQKGKDKNYDAIKPVFVSFSDFPATEENIVQQYMDTKTDKFIPDEIAKSSKDHLLNLIRSVFGKKEKEDVPELGFMLIPKYNKLRGVGITSIPDISSIGFGLVNESVFNRVSSRNSDENTANNCKTFCDTDIVSEICNCGTTYTPVPYFQNLRANFFHIFHPNGTTSTITLPVNANSWGFLGHERSFKTTYPPIKKIYGKPTVSAGNVLATKLIDYDMTPELNAVLDNNDAINEYIYSPTDGQIMNASDFYDQLSNLNDITVAPQKNISMVIGRTKLSNLGLDISQSAGLTSMSINMGANGVKTDLSFSTRPPFIPKPDVYFQKIKYRLKP